MARERRVETIRERVQVGTEEGFIAFYQRHAPSLSGAIGLAFGDPVLGVEAVDEAMVRAYTRWSKISGYDRPEAWVYRVAHNWAIGRLRKQGRELVVADLPETEFSDPRPLDPALRDALAALTPDQRSVVVLRVWLDWSTAATAEGLGISQGTVKSRLARSLDSLRARLTEVADA